MRKYCHVENVKQCGVSVSQAEDPNTLADPVADQKRTGFRRIELMEFSNNLGYKELGRLDKAGYKYRIPKVDAQYVICLLI